jgi:glycine betaine/proline transport system ATP-binding protein
MNNKAQAKTSHLRDQASTSSVALSCEHLWKIYGPHPEQFMADGGETVTASCDEVVASGDHIPAVADISFQVHRGEIFVIMGLSGSGKSTAIRCLARLVEPTSGSVTFENKDFLNASSRELIEIRRHKIGMVFQHFGLIPNLSVLENVAFPLKLQGVRAHEREERAAAMIELVGLTGRERNYPRELSGGQQQRVGIARSLCVDPDLWLLDEPFSALDPLIRRQLQDEFLRIQQRLSKTIVFITHDFMEAIKIADRIAIMRNGTIVQIGTPLEIITAPADDYVAQFSGDVPHCRVITAANLMHALGDEHTSTAADRLPQVAPDATLEEILPHFGAATSEVAVANGTGAVLGTITIDRALQSMQGIGR